MSIDIYSPCPCGSGKKFKFCCHVIADDMDRIVRLIEGNQPRVALQQLEILAKKHPTNAWVGTTRGMMLLDLNEVTTARDVLRSALEVHPDNELAIVLYAGAMIRAEGFGPAKRAIHRAFQRSAKKLPGLVGDLATSLASANASLGKMMAAREHLALALRLAPEDRRQQLFVQLLELDGADEIPYPMRGSHQIPNISGSDEIQKEVRKAQKYAAIGCWSVAADLFATLANASPEQAELWHATGLCRAWDGDEKNAAEALHRAARHYQEIGTAVECETLAQILDDKTTTDVVEECVYQATLHSVSRLLTEFDAQSRLQRLKLPKQNEGRTLPIAAYLVLDADRNEDDLAQLSMETVPRFFAQITIFDADQKTGAAASLILAGLRKPTFDDAKALVTTAGGELIEWSKDGLQVTGSVSAESLILENHWYLPTEISAVRRRSFFDQFWSQVVSEKWPRHALKALGGKTPEQAATDSSLRIPLLGAIYALDAAAQRREKGVGLGKLFARLNVEPLPPINVTEQMNLGGLSILQLNRLPVEKLSDQQLVTVVNRSMLIQHDETLYEVLKAAVARPACAEQFDLARILRTLGDLSASNGNRVEAFSWIERGRNLPVPEGKTAFQHAWAWDMSELGMRLEDPTDPELKVLLQRFVNYYGPKVPQIRPHIEQMLQECGVPSPWESLDVLTATSLPTPGQLWNPAAKEPVGAGGGKLWLPGQ